VWLINNNKFLFTEGNTKYLTDNIQMALKIIIITKLYLYISFYRNVQEPESEESAQERDQRTVFCMQLARNIRPRDLEEFFSKVGQVC
jgi:RNA recognition motif-containing protein